jgi:molybdopterin converting factor small subunit
MKISIEFLGMQRIITQTGYLDMQITNQTRVNDAFEHVRQKYPALDLKESMVLVTVNQEMADMDKTLKADDIVSFLPLIGGG